MKPVLFVQANPRQMLGARIAAYSFTRNTHRPASFDVRIISIHDFPRLTRPGQSILRGGYIRQWEPDDLQSFTPPSLMSFQGRALVVDPDCFAVGDVIELLDRDMGGKAIMARRRTSPNGARSYIASSVMLLDCAKLRHWNFERLLDDLFARKFDYLSWNQLEMEDRSTIGFLEPEWNSFDELGPCTKILHTTKRRTQPWKTGLPIDYTHLEGRPFRRFRTLVQSRYRRHPDPNQEAYVFSLLAEMLDSGVITLSEIEAEMRANHIRHDALAVIDRWRGWNAIN